jgi:hypothetical protein
MPNRAFCARLFVLALVCAALAAYAADTGLRRDVVFDSYTPLSTSAQVTQRLLSPLLAKQVNRSIAAMAQAPRDQAVDLAREKFVLYVPAAEPPQGYALMVFVPPWEEAKLPPGWGPVLERHGVIFVSAANSGNAANVLDRREPLALLAAHNVQRQYRVDASRIYVGGFSGGARVALRLALAYPDLFRGALLNAGSDPIGDEQIPIPSESLFRQFQDSVRLIYLTGKNDSFHLDQDMRSRRSMQEWCVADVVTQTVPWIGHEVAEAAALDRALSTLSTRVAPDAEKLASCRARISAEVGAKMREVEGLVADGKTEQARTALRLLDAHYGGLASPHSLEIADKIGGY